MKRYLAFLTMTVGLLIGCGAMPASNVTPRPDRQPAMLIYYIADDGDGADLYVLDTQTDEITQLTYDALTEVSATLSPDGNRIAYATIAAGGTGAQFVMNTDGSARTQVGEGMVRGFDWTPDGASLVYTIEGAALDDSIIVAQELQTGTVRTLVKSASNSKLSPDGKWLAYIGMGTLGGPLIYVADANGVEVQALAKADNDFQWSLDGGMIAYQANRTSCIYSNGPVQDVSCSPESDLDILVSSFNGTQISAQPEDNNEDDFYPLWIPDGRVVFLSGYIEARNWRISALIYDSRTAQNIKLADFPSLAGVARFSYVGRCNPNDGSRLHFITVGSAGSGRSPVQFVIDELQEMPLDADAKEWDLPRYQAIGLGGAESPELTEQIARGLVDARCKE